jgi:hypothetical protein
MPTVQRPQLDHVSFPWHEQSDLFHRELEAQRAKILELSGFDREFGNPGNPPSILEEREAAAFILELSGILSRAAAIKMDGGDKPANKVIATLKSVKKDPSLIFKGGVEPEALSMVASNYQRGHERPGTFWFDVDQPVEDLLQPDLQRVSKAASVAIEAMQALAHTGRPHDVMLDFLGDRLLSCYRRFNETAGRHSVASDGEWAQTESGPFLGFLSSVIAPLNRFLIRLPASYGAKCISAPELARRALRSPGKMRFPRVRKFLLSIFRKSPTQFPP